MSIYNDYHVLLQLFDQHGYALVSYLLGFFFYRESLIPGLLPCVGMEFRNSDEAWAFWLSYGGQKSFEVRKRYTNKTKGHPTAGLHHADLFVQMSAERKTKWII